ncbi:MAG: BlaI/MecI/CopY family transcriptional regulator [Candidatus Eremiobacteraeota bacterium]|nr:BlaI/MecI/CopY family transcriptional regulator [Candidatus Eremiobacteraeota bacterium]
MARKKSPTLTEAEYRLMDILWSKGPRTVGEVVDAVGEPPLAYNTVLTTLQILEQKGYVRHKASGRAFIYRPAIEREDAQRDVVQHVVSRFFNNSPGELVLNLIESEQVDASELDRLRDIIDAARRPGQSERP